MRFLLALFAAGALMAAEYAAPAGTRSAVRNPGAAGILPGGRIIAPLGRQYPTGPGPFGLALSPSGRLLVSADGGPDRYSLTVLRKEKDSWRPTHLVAPRKKRNEPEPEPGEDSWRSVFMGLAFDTDRTLYASEGESARVRAIDPQTGRLKALFDLNQGEYRDSYTGDLAFDSARHLLWVVDQANFRVAAIDVRAGRILSSIRVGRLPFAIAVSPDARRLYVTNIGMFQYSPIPGVDPKKPRETGLPFPAFGFPSPEAEKGARRETARGPVDVAGLGDPNAPESNSLAVIDASDPSKPALVRFVRTGLPFGPRSNGGSSPSGVLCANGRVFVSNGHNDSITVIDAKTLEVQGTVELRIPGLENLRGILPIGLAYDKRNNWLIAAEAGINALAVVDARTLRVLGHLPTGWFPSRVVASEGQVFVTNAKGHGTGPNVEAPEPGGTFQGVFRRGTISIFPVPSADELRTNTGRVFLANGFVPVQRPPAALPQAVRYIVLIVKENRTFDEVFGDRPPAGNGPVKGDPNIARFGRRANVPFIGRGRVEKLVVRNVNVSPNHQALSERFAFSDNFYADSEVSVDGHHWLVGSYPDAWTETSLMASYGGYKDFRVGAAPGRLEFPTSNSSVHPEEQLEAGAIWHHLERHGIPFRNFGEGFELAGVDEGPGLKPTGARYVTNVPMPDPLFRNTSREYAQFNMNIPDQFRATQFIAEMHRARQFPRFIYIHLPNDHTAKPRSEDGYPYEASYMADNDYALGRILEYLSGLPQWREMAVFITEDDAQGWVDHVDSHRTVLLVASPYAKKNYVSHVNASFPGLLKTIFRFLGLPPLNLFDAAASDLSDCFTAEPDFTPYRVLPEDDRIFVPAKAKDPLDPKPSVRMDDPAFLHDQHRK